MRTDFEVADIIDLFYNEGFRRKLPVYKQKTLSALSQCRTASLGGHINVCDKCNHTIISYNSCRNRHCPKCQSLQKEMWTIQRENELLQVAYFHVVFTLPHEFNGLCTHNPRFMYDLLFESAWYVLKTFANDKQWLGAKSAATMVLHTWGQNLSLHPHIHCIVPSGGLTKEGKWQNPRKGNADFLYPILAMNVVYKAYFLKRLRQHLEEGELSLYEDFPMGKEYYNWKESLYKKEWVIYIKPPFGGAKHVVKYLARYSHRVAITNQRILNVTDQNVTFKYKDYNDNAKHKVMCLTGSNFLNRFCLHILPSRYRKIRYLGFIANSCKKKNLALARNSLKAKHQIALTRKERKALALERILKNDFDLCPFCNKGTMIIRDTIPSNKDPPYMTARKISQSLI